jgi:D-alanyl-D-alanine carboxypeptidase/D-alanyl-D-alanine-endopeptidase (penicillin-binding protein 4)
MSILASTLPPSRRRVTATLAFLAFFLPALQPALAQSDERLPQPVARALKSAGVPQTAVAVLVQEVDSRIPRTSFNAGQPMNPASIMKLVTTYAALELLGPAYTWKTEAYAQGSAADGVLSADLYLKGYGDPRFTFENFWLLLRQIRAKGIREIRGDLVLDRGYFDNAGYDPARFDQEPLRPYNVGPDALLLNFKAVRFSFFPDAEGKAVQISAEPHPAQLDIINLLKPGGAPCNGWKDGVRIDFTPTPAGVRAVFTGSYPVACGEKQWHFGLLSHPQYVAGVFRQLWEELGGRFTGNLSEGPLPAGARLLASAESASLAEVVRDINKFSNNVMARQLFLTLAAEASRQPARAEDGEAAVKAWLAQKELRMPELVMENGSGLSRRERISAENLGRLLLAAYASPLMPEFIASMPLVAVDGTMKKRLGGNGIAGHAHIKTGTLEGVKAIAGYVLDRKGRRSAVVFLVNHPNAGAAQAAQDALLVCVYERSC